MSWPRFPGPRWLHATLCLALGLASLLAGLAGTLAGARSFATPGLPMAAALALAALLVLALSSRRLGGPRVRLWMLAILFGLLIGAIWTRIELGGGLAA